MKYIHILKTIDPLVGRLGMLLPPPEGKPDVVPRTVLVIRPGGIGDAVLLVPALQVLRSQFPGLSIDILSERRNAGVFKLCPGLGSVYRYDVPNELLQVLRCSYDVIIDTEQWHRLSAVVARVVRGGGRIGFETNDRRRLFSHPISYSQEDYEADSFMKLLTPLGISEGGELRVPFLSVPPSASKKVNEIISSLEERPFVAIFPGASIAERRWGAERFRELASRLRKRCGVVVVGGAVDRDDAESIEQAGALNLAGKTTLAETAAIIARSSLLVSGDSGILHIAVGLGIPTVSLFGPGRARKWAPRGADHIVINRNLPCSPCTTFGYTPKCPINARCMAEISVDEVEQAVMTLLARKNFGKRNKSLD